MALTVKVTAPSVLPQTEDAFREDARVLLGVFDILRAEARIPDIDLDLRLTDSFVADVERLRRPYSDGTRSEPFTTDRVGGTTTAKNLPQTDDGSAVIIVFSSDLWKGDDGTTPFARAQQIAVIAHELSHPLFDRARHAAGLLTDGKYPDRTGTEMMRSTARLAWDEYRAEALADILISTISSIDVGGVPRPLQLWDLWGDANLESLRDVLGRAHPVWPDLVESYMDRRKTLTEMWYEIARSVSQTFTMLARIQAQTNVAELPDPLAHESLADLPATHLYIGQPWSDFRTVLKAQPMLPTLESLQAVEERVVATGERSFRAIIGALGLKVSDLPDKLWIDVTEPSR